MASARRAAESRRGICGGARCLTSSPPAIDAERAGATINVLGLELRHDTQPLLDRGPVLLERIRSRPPAPRRRHLRRQLADGDVLARGLVVHIRLYGGLVVLLNTSIR